VVELPLRWRDRTPAGEGLAQLLAANCARAKATGYSLPRGIGQCCADFQQVGGATVAATRGGGRSARRHPLTADTMSL
jgi:hypothetical protein